MIVNTVIGVQETILIINTSAISIAQTAQCDNFSQMFFLMENIVNNAAQLIWVFVVIGMH